MDLYCEGTNVAFHIRDILILFDFFSTFLSSNMSDLIRKDVIIPYYGGRVGVGRIFTFSIAPL